jgi:septal ring factor EnvC (AmiA/AmiB activator)
VSRVAALGVVALFAAALGAAPDDGSRRLEELRGEIEARESRAQALAREAEGVLGELEAIDRNLHELGVSLRLLREQERAAGRDLEALEGRVRQAEKAREELQGQLERRLVALYKFHVSGGIPAFYAAGTFQELLLRRVALTRVLKQDEELFARYRAAETRWGKEQEAVAALVPEIQEARRAASVRDARMRQSLVERQNLVALLRTRADREHQVAAELREAAERLGRLLAERAPGAEVPGEPLLEGGVPWPVRGRIRLGFGPQLHPEFGTETVRNGIEIEAPRGTPVRAVAPGRVLYAGWFKGYGQIVILEHGEQDVTVSGYLEEVAVDSGVNVAFDDVIGRVGETGSFSGPGLYFELRHAGEPVDPALWLGSLGRPFRKEGSE